MSAFDPKRTFPTLCRYGPRANDHAALPVARRNKLHDQTAPECATSSSLWRHALGQPASMPMEPMAPSNFKAQG